MYSNIHSIFFLLRIMGVTVANGDKDACCGLARDVALRICDEFFTVDCYTIPLDCYDPVLGVSFLRTLGPILWDFEDICMAFWHGGKRVLWKGVDSARWDIALTTSRLNSINKEECPLLDNFLDSFEDVFDQPTGLPPSRPCDHQIQLLPDTAPVVWPYQYPHLQKDELEQKCATMLEQGIVRPNTSPFSAHGMFVLIIRLSIVR
jgi:hypothetical protein